jgi:exopolysaccharide biosynthesis operon protein EpsL
MACLAAVLVQGSAVAVATGAAGQQGPQVYSIRAGHTAAAEPFALPRRLARLFERTAEPMPQPGNWALVLAGLIGAGTIARRRKALMTRSLAVRPPADVRSAGRTGAGNLSYGVAGLLLLPATHSHAQDPAKLTPFVEETLTTDDNVFRISSAVDPATVIGSSSRGDTYRTTSFGLAAEMPVSLQRFVANLTFNNTRYQRFSQLDSNGHDLRASWLWQAGKDLAGELGYSDTYSLAGFAQTLSTTPDLLKLRQGFVNGTWMVTPYWQLRAAGDHLEQRNSAAASLYNDVTINGVEASVSRLSRAGNSIGLGTRIESGRFPTPEALGTALVDNAYRQYAVGPRLDWTISGVSHLTARADQVSRRYDQLPQRNFDGQTAHAEFTWTPTGKLTLTAFAQRDISPYEYVRSDLVLLKGFGLRPAWHMSPKIDLSADLEVVTRSYLADAAQALGLLGQRDDRVHAMSALLVYHPLHTLTLQASLLHESRSSSVVFGDYAANVAWINARLAF